GNFVRLPQRVVVPRGNRGVAGNGVGNLGAATRENPAGGGRRAGGRLAASPGTGAALPGTARRSRGEATRANDGVPRTVLRSRWARLGCGGGARRAGDQDRDDGKQRNGAEGQ